MAGKDWSDAENDLIVADYLAMLKAELAGNAHPSTFPETNWQWPTRIGHPGF